MSRKFIAVSGYGWSGSGAVVDLLREFQGITFIPGEFRLVKDPNGLLDLEWALFESNDFLRANLAIMDFVKFSNVLARKDSKYFGRGGNYLESISKKFLDITNEFVSELSVIQFKNRSMVFEYHLSPIQFLFMKIFSRIGLIERSVQSIVPIQSSEKYRKLVREYLNRIFDGFTSTEDTILLDQVIPAGRVSKALNYFEDLKLILVDRDPRDIYVDLVNKKALIGADLAANDDVDKFVAWFLSQRTGESYFDSRVHRVKFENLILNHEEELSKIKRFLGDDYHHIEPARFLKVIDSSKNVSQWKNYKDPLVMDEIKERLSIYCES